MLCLIGIQGCYLDSGALLLEPKSLLNSMNKKRRRDGYMNQIEEKANLEIRILHLKMRTVALARKITSGNDCIDNENEAYVHEAFLADWRPDTSGVSLELPTSNFVVKSIPSLLSSQENCHNKEQSNSNGFRDLQCQIGQQFSESLKH